MVTIDYPQKKIKVLFLSHDEFRKSFYWRQVRNLVDAAYKRDSLPHESINNYRKAFMGNLSPGKTMRKHMLLVHEPTGTVLSHHNAISTCRPKNCTVARLGHMVAQPNITVSDRKLSNYHLDNILIPFLKKLGFKIAKGSHYSIVGAVVGEKKGFTGYSITSRGKKYMNIANLKGSEGIIITIRNKNYGPDMLKHYRYQL